MRRWIGGGLVAAVTLAAAACGSSGSDAGVVEQGEPATAAVLVSASRQTQEAQTGRYELTVEVGDGSGPMAFELTGSGAFDLDAGRSSASMSMDSLLGDLLGSVPSDETVPDELADGGLDVQVVMDGDVTYVRSSLLSWLAGGVGDRWLRLDPEELAAQAAELGIDPTDLGDLGTMTGGPATPMVDPGQILDMLEEVGAEVTEVGVDTVGGVDTTHYRATVDLRELLEQTADELERAGVEQDLARLGVDPAEAVDGLTLPVDVYVDADGYVRRTVVAVASSGATDGALGAVLGDLDVTITVDYQDLGEPVDIAVPAPGDTVPLTELLDGLGQQLGGFGRSLGAPGATTTTGG